jgi:hypothetical protein
VGSDIQVAACSSKINAEGFTNLFFDKWFCENRCPLEIISNRDKLFISKFWRVLTKLARVKLKMSSAYHLQTNGMSEQTNKMVIQCLRYHIACNQKGWVKSLPKVHFDIINTMNSLTGFSLFMLKTRKSLCLLPPLLEEVSDDEDPSDGAVAAKRVLGVIENNICSACDCMPAAKVSQVHHTNRDHTADLCFKVGDLVMLTTAQQRRKYMQAKDGRVAKFMARYDGLYQVLEAFPKTSTYKLKLPTTSNVFSNIPCLSTAASSG